MANAKLTFYTKDLLRLHATLARVEKVPQRAVTRAAGKGATVVRKAVRGTVPVRTGALKRGIVRKGERPRVKGQKVYALMFDPGMNAIFQKPIKNPGEAGGERDPGYAYYPASMEYGFLTRSKGGGLSYVKGRHFMREAAEKSEFQAKSTMIKAFISEMEKEWAK